MAAQNANSQTYPRVNALLNQPLGVQHEIVIPNKFRVMRHDRGSHGEPDAFVVWAEYEHPGSTAVTARWEGWRIDTLETILSLTTVSRPSPPQ